MNILENNTKDIVIPHHSITSITLLLPSLKNIKELILKYKRTNK